MIRFFQVSFPLLTLVSFLLVPSCSGVAGGASRSALTYHFSKQGQNSADIAAKEGSQETLASLIGMLLGYFILRYMDAMQKGRGQETIQWVVFFLLTLFHMFANYKAVRSLNLNSINDEKISYFWVSINLLLSSSSWILLTELSSSGELLQEWF